MLQRWMDEGTDSNAAVAALCLATCGMIKAIMIHLAPACAAKHFDP
jgi:hypothetical protein